MVAQSVEGVESVHTGLLAAEIKVTALAEAAGHHTRGGRVPAPDVPAASTAAEAPTAALTRQEAGAEQAEVPDEAGDLSRTGLLASVEAVATTRGRGSQRGIEIKLGAISTSI